MLPVGLLAQFVECCTGIGIISYRPDFISGLILTTLLVVFTAQIALIFILSVSLVKWSLYVYINCLFHYLE